MNPEELKERMRGTLVGQALGDACGFPLEGLTPQRCKEQAGNAVAGKLSRSEAGFDFGQYTDDTQMAVAIARSLAEKKAVDPPDVARRFGELWSQGRIVGQGLACRSAVMRILDGIPWKKAGAPEGRAGNGAAMRTAPVGLFLHGDHDALAAAADQIGSITHRDARARAGAVAIALAVAHLASGGDPSPDVLAGLITPRVAGLHQVFADLIGELPKALSQSTDDAMAWFTSAGFSDGGTDGWEGITPYVIPTVLGSLYSFMKHPEDYIGAIRFVIECGGDVDTTAAITGALSGSHLGLSAIPDGLARKVNDRGRMGYDELVRLADDLFEAASADETI
jgi:ADP-ribosylglycohydrolase